MSVWVTLTINMGNLNVSMGNSECQHGYWRKYWNPTIYVMIGSLQNWVRKYSYNKSYIKDLKEEEK